MGAVANSGITLNLDNDDAEKPIKILTHHSKLNVGTPREGLSDEIDDLSELSDEVEKLEDALVRSCKTLRSFIKRSGENLSNSTSNSITDDDGSF